MIPKQEEATGRMGGNTTDGSTPTLSEASDICSQLRTRRYAAARKAPSANSLRDPLDGERLPVEAGSCSRSFACLAQPIEVLQRAYCCPCREARTALGLAS
jgi:hypothetical protein